MWRWIAIIVGLLCAAFLALGFIKPDIQVVNSTLINRSPQVVWQVFTDVPRAREWMTGLQGMETLSGEPLAVGSRHKLTFLEDNREIALEEVITAVEPGKLYAFDTSMTEMKGSTNVRLTPKDGGTEVTFESSYAGQSIVWRSMMVIMKSSISRREARDLAKLKALIEAGPA